MVDYAGVVSRDGRSESSNWERSPPRSGTRWWAVVAVIAGTVIALGIVPALRGSPSATLSVGPTGAPIGPAIPDSVDPDNFDGARLRPVETSTQRSGSGPLLPGAPDLTIVAADGTSLRLLDTDTGDLRRVVVRRPGRASLSGTLFVVGGGIVVDADNDVVFVPLSSALPTRVAASHRAVPTTDDSSVWVFDNSTPYTAGTASRVALDGTVLDTIVVPAVAQPISGTADGLLVSTPGAVTLISDDGQPRRVAQGTAVATDGQRLASLQCGEDLSCAVTIGTIDEPAHVRTQLGPSVLPAGYFGLPTGSRRQARMTARFSPDGRWLALPLHESRGGRGLDNTTTVAIIDTATGRETQRLEGSSLSPFDSPLAWSPDGVWLIFVSGRDVHAWRAADGRTVTIDADLAAVRALAVR